MADDPQINPNPYVDPENAALLQQLGSLTGGRALTTLPLDQQREVFQDAQKPAPKHPNVAISHFEVETKHGKVKTFSFRPKDQHGDLPFFYQLHGGGWILGNAFDYIGFLSDLVDRTGFVAVFPEYTLAPEKTFPVQQEQCVEVLQYLIDHGQEKQLLVDKVVIIGDSAGGQLAPAVNIINRQKSLHLSIAHQILISPIVDLTSLSSTFSQFEFQNGPFLTTAFIEETLRNYIPDTADRQTITASPILMSAKETKEFMPPTTILVSQDDWLRDQGENFAKKLQQAGVQCGVLQSVAAVHDFVVFNKSRKSPTAELIMIVLAGKLKEVLGEESRKANGNGERASKRNKVS